MATPGLQKAVTRARQTADVSAAGAPATPEAAAAHQQNRKSSNPFRLYDDEALFALQESERAAKRQALEAKKLLQVHGKTTLSVRMQACNGGKDGEPNPRRFISRELRRAAGEGSPPPPPVKLVEKENIRAFIAKKREIFFVQLSLDIKREEMARLQERAQQHEAALTNAEAMLDGDAAGFDAFLKDNDEKVQAALRRADAESKAKQEKVNELNRLKLTLGIAQSELRKVQEQLDECRKHAAFLDRITPPEWFAAQTMRHQAEWQAQVDAWNAECAAIRDAREAARGAKAAAQERYDNARTQQQANAAHADIHAASAELKRALAAVDPPPPRQLSEEEAHARHMAEPMFFQDPRQLRQVFGQLEEASLFLIQNAQESAEALEAATRALQASNAQLDAEAADLREQSAALRREIAVGQEHARALREKREGQADSVETAPVPHAAAAAPLEELRAKIASVWARSGGDADARALDQGAPLPMLAALEAHLERVIAAAAQLPPELAEATEHAREKQRRQVARQEKLAQQRADQERRAQRALARAAAPAFRKHGKPAMFRSVLPESDDAADAAAGQQSQDAELEDYLALMDLR